MRGREGVGMKGVGGFIRGHLAKLLSRELATVALDYTAGQRSPLACIYQ